jgi:hypothetical protein
MVLLDRMVFKKTRPRLKAKLRVDLRSREAGSDWRGARLGGAIRKPSNAIRKGGRWSGSRLVKLPKRRCRGLTEGEGVSFQTEAKVDGCSRAEHTMVTRGG